MMCFHDGDYSKVAVICVRYEWESGLVCEEAGDKSL